jgi:hypothetical protein
MPKKAFTLPSPTFRFVTIIAEKAIIPPTVGAPFSSFPYYVINAIK